MSSFLEKCLCGGRALRLSRAVKLLLCLGLLTFLLHGFSSAARRHEPRGYRLENRADLERIFFKQRLRAFQPITASSDTIDTVIDRAREIYKLGKPVMINVFNNGFLNMTLNWLCHTEPMNIHQHVLLVTLDVDSTNTIRAAGFHQVHIVTLTDDPGSQVKGDTSYGKVGYHRLLYTRSRVLSALLKAGIEVIQFESDATWFVDPFPFTLHYVHLNSVNSDLVSLTCSDRPYLIATGYMYLRPSKSIVSIFTELDEAMGAGVERHKNRSDKDKSLDKGLYDQPLLSKIYKGYKTSLVSRVVPWDIAPDGKWYDKPEVQNRTNPLMLSNNWTVGNYRKITRAKKFGHWFLDDGAVCKRDMARAFVEQNLQKCTEFCP